MLKPQSDWVVTKQIKSPEQKPHTLVLVINPAKEQTKFVEIVSFGPEANKENYLKVGDIVIVPEVSGIKTKHEDVEYEMAKEKNFLAVWEG